MEKRNLKISFNKSGSGSITPKISLPKVWIDAMEIDLDNRDVTVAFENGKITIEKLNIEE